MPQASPGNRRKSGRSDASSGLGYLIAPAEPAGRLIVVSGDEAFLRGEVVAALRQTLVGEGDAELDWRVFAGPEADWADVADAVRGRSLFGGGGDPVACVEDGDPFVTRYRDELEAFAESQAAGRVVLVVKSLPGNTRLAKRVASSGTHLRCSTPTKGAEVNAFRRDAAKWLAGRARSRHGATLGAGVAELLFELLPDGLGLLDQEVARLALLAGEGGEIDVALAKQHVGGWRTQTAWDMIDAVVEGRAADALTQVDRLVRAGEQPIGLLAQLGSTLRKFSTAAIVVNQAESLGKRPSLSAAIQAAGFPPFKREAAARQLRQLGRRRANKLAAWVLEADLAMKGYNSPPARARGELERLIVRLSREAAATAG